MNQQPKTVQTIVLIAILALVLVVISSSLLTQNSGRLAYSDVLDLFETERVESFVLQGDTLTMTVYRQGSTMELTVTVGEQVQSALANEQTQQTVSDNPSGGRNGYPFGGRR